MGDVLKKLPLFIFLLFLFTGYAPGQSIVEEIKSSEEMEYRSSDLFVERIKMISRSKRIFLLTNENRMLYKGDFISLLLDKNLVCRAIVAKVTENRVGIKIIKIYSLALWQQLRRELDVQIIRGDDSYFYKKKVEPSDELEDDVQDKDGKIMSTEDLYSTTDMDDMGFDENKKRVLPNDNLVSANYGVFGGINKDGQSQQYSQWNAGWAYQMSDDVFVEGVFGVSQISQFPVDGVNAAAINMTARLKYAFKLPLYSYALPYVGFQMMTMQLSNSQLSTSAQALVSDMEKNQLVYGVSLMRRLVPGWFVKADLGTDLLNVGFAIEF
jgi:hypothetical protein